jgi:histone deacetylase 11
MLQAEPESAAALRVAAAWGPFERESQPKPGCLPYPSVTPIEIAMDRPSVARTPRRGQSASAAPDSRSTLTRCYSSNPRVTVILFPGGYLLSMEPRLVYRASYNIRFFGAERLHPFDSRKYGRAWSTLRRRWGRRLLSQITLRPKRPVSRDELLHVHSAAYLTKLQNPTYLAGALEVPIVKRAPAWLIDWRVLRPMRWATAGTTLAAREALKTGLAINLSGGYHHASPERGEGFSIYADAALAVDHLRRENLIGESDKIAYVDCDAHQGNGVCRCFMSDPRAFIFDMYNQAIFPALDVDAKRRVDCAVPLPLGCSEVDYLAALRSKLPPFLDSISRQGRVALAIYNAGTDIYGDDSLGGMCVSTRGVLERDQFVLDQLVCRGIPTVMLPSGGYSRESYMLIANTIDWVIEKFVTQR